MSSVSCFRDFICDRLSAVAEEIFQVFEKTVLEYEEQLRLQRTVSKPQTHSHEFPQRDVFKQEQEEILTQHQPVSRSSLQQEDPEPVHVKEEHQDLCSSRDDEPLVLKQETDISPQTDACEIDILDEAQTLSLDRDNSHYSAMEEKYMDNMIIERAQVLDQNNENQLLFSRVSSENHDDAEYQFGEWESPSSTRSPGKSFKCEICGKTFHHRSTFIRHHRIHTGVKPFTCNMCGKGFNQSSMLMDHKRVHTGDKPYPCDICGKKFLRRSCVTVHRRVHTGEKPFSCDVCGKNFISSAMLKRHSQNHAGVKPFSCLICGKRFFLPSELKKHTRVHAQ